MRRGPCSVFLNSNLKPNAFALIPWTFHLSLTLCSLLKFSAFHIPHSDFSFIASNLEPQSAKRPLKTSIFTS